MSRQRTPWFPDATGRPIAFARPDVEEWLGGIFGHILHPDPHLCSTDDLSASRRILIGHDAHSGWRVIGICEPQPETKLEGASPRIVILESDVVLNDDV